MVDEIKDHFGIEMSERKIDKIDGIPYYMARKRTFLVLDSYGIDFLLVCLSQDDKFGVSSLKKQALVYSKKMGMNVAFHFQSMNSVQRNALIKNNVPFICLPGQLYLPFLAVSVNSIFKKAKGVEASKLSPAGQALFLYLLYDARLDQVMKKQAADALHVTKTSITRASDQLAAIHLINQEEAGKEIWMKAVESGKKYIELAMPYLINPVQKTIAVSFKEWLLQYPISGETALSKMSMLNPPCLNTIAIWNKDPVLKNLEPKDPEWEGYENCISVEIYKYDPMLFARGNAVDTVSLMLSLKNNKDERIQGELARYMEKYYDSGI